MITLQDVWCVHIIPQLDVEDVYAFYQTSRRAAELVEMARNWKRVYATNFEGLYIDTGTPFLSFLSRYRARVVIPGGELGGVLAQVPESGLKTIVGAFEQSMLAVLDVKGTLHCSVHAEVPQRPFSQVFGLDHYLYGLEANGTVSAWTSATRAPVRFTLDARVSKVCSVGYLCAALTDQGVYWWQKPHGAYSKMEYERLSVSVCAEDIAATRYGIVFISQNKLYELKLLDSLLRPVPQVVPELLGTGFSRLEQSGEWFVAHGASILLGNGCERRCVPASHAVHAVQAVHSVQIVGSNVYTLDSQGTLSRDNTPLKGLYAEMAALRDDIYAIRVC